MPVYEYQCQTCGFAKEKIWRKAASAKEEIACDNCDAVMGRIVSSSNFAFKHDPKQLNGMNPPNTGTSDDYDYDKAIGRDAAEKWETIGKRNSLKDETIREARKNDKVVVRDQLVYGEEGGYRVIEEAERVKANERREAAYKIAQSRKKKRKRKTRS